MEDDLVPVVAIRLAEGRSGSTLLMRLLSTCAEIVFDDRYPSEYRYLSYFARMASMMTEPFDDDRHVGVTPFFFSDEPRWGPVPFRSEILEIGDLTTPLLTQMWRAWSNSVRSRHPAAQLYAEKIAVDVDQLAAAAIPLRVIDLVRDPRDVLASIKAFTASGIDGFGRTLGVDEAVYLRHFINTFGDGLEQMRAPVPNGVERIVVRYEDLITDMASESARIGEWLGTELDSRHVMQSRAADAHHITSSSPAASIGRWRQDLSSEDALLISNELRERAAPFGYEL